MSGKYKIEPRHLDRDSVNQLNKIFDSIESDIGKGGTTAPAITPARVASPSGPINVGGSVPGNVTEINKGGSAPGPVGPPGPAGVSSVLTDGTTIGGDGNATPLFLEVPVALSSGGTGLVQGNPQQIITLGTAVAAGTVQAQKPLTIVGVTTESAAMWSLPNVPDATWQTGITMMLVCTTDTVTPYLVNPTASSITPISQLVSIKVIL